MPSRFHEPNRCNANEEFKLVSLLRQAQYNAMFLITFAHIHTHLHALHNFPLQQRDQESVAADGLGVLIASWFSCGPRLYGFFATQRLIFWRSLTFAFSRFLATRVCLPTQCCLCGIPAPFLRCRAWPLLGQELSIVCNSSCL